MEPFYVLGQLSITVAGFAALFSILKPPSKDWNLHDKLNLIRFYVMIELACLVSLFSFFPVLLADFLELHKDFQISLWALFVIAGIYHTYVFIRNKRYSEENKVAIAGRATIAISVVTISNLFFSLIAATGLIGNDYKSYYLIALYVLFAVDLYFFLRLIYFTTHHERDNSKIDQ